MLSLAKSWIRPAESLHSVARRAFGVSSYRQKKQMPPRPKHPDESEFTEVFLKGSGPGGQKINKTSSAVQLKHVRTGLVVKVQETRSRSQNRKIARQLLADRIEILEKGSQSRAAVLEATKVKRKSSAIKKSQRKYKALAAAKSDTADLSADASTENALEPNGSDVKVDAPHAGKGKSDA